MGEADGASPREQIIEACRRDNVDLFQEVLDGMKGKSKEDIAKFFNNVVDTMGNYLLHICANYGSYDVMNELLDVEFLECDPLTRRDKETPLHSAVRYANERELELGEAMVKMLCEAGGDPRIRDTHGRKPADTCAPRAEGAKATLRQEEYILSEGLRKQDDEGEDAAGSASDSD
ncbi:hypothetical protein OHC33_004013 [Knufia fluminis]|uniref:Ankyrin repeat protein n=1 Tax=Knufia fluminis TaxID=191047 RepID=A0AAN8FBR9_9EURO|nr:hypothetical protein OHC33_004013 [Knufia fluminis]